MVVRCPSNPLAGYRFTFARAPWVLLLEVVSCPQPAADTAFRDAGMYTPPAS